jgi:hypothetical protein
VKDCYLIFYQTTLVKPIAIFFGFYYIGKLFVMCSQEIPAKGSYFDSIFCIFPGNDVGIPGLVGGVIGLGVGGVRLGLGVPGSIWVD